MSAEIGDNIKATKRPPSVICIQSIFSVAALLFPLPLLNIKNISILIHSTYCEMIFFTLRRLLLFVLHLILKDIYPISLLTTCVPKTHPTPLYFKKKQQTLNNRSYENVFVILCVCAWLFSQFGIAVLAPGWSLIGYALQILRISPCFVGGFKKLMSCDLRFKYKKLAHRRTRASGRFKTLEGFFKKAMHASQCVSSVWTH